VETRKWLIAAFCDDETDKERIIQELYRDTTRFMGYSKDQPFPYELAFEPAWIEVGELRTSDLYSIADKIVEVFKKQKCEGRVLLLDRDLLVRSGLGKMYLCIVGHPFYKNDLSGYKLLCCFGGDMRRVSLSEEGFEECKPDYNDCIKLDNETRTYCACDKLANCNHTCYWLLVGRLLGAYPRPRQKNSQPDKAIQEALPKRYIS